MSQKLSTVITTFGLGIFLLITCAYKGENQKAEASSSTDTTYQIKKQKNKQASIVKTEFGQHLDWTKAIRFAACCAGNPRIPLGQTHNGQTVHLFSLTNANGSKQNNLGEIIAPDTQVEKVAGGFEFTEGPLWHPDGFLLFSDIPANTIYKWQPKQETEIFRQPSGNANGNTLDKSGRLITGEHGNRRVSRTEKNGTVVTLASNYEGKRLNSPNDLAVKSDGSIYFTDPPYGIESEQEELGFYGVYRLAPDGTLTLLVDDFVRPNGIVFSTDETKLYVNDSEEGHIRVFDVKPDGTLENGKLFAELEPPSQEGAADGMKIDIKGNIYSTGPRGVWVFDPSGKLLGIIEVPEAPANLAWGDNDYQTLYITARNSLYRVQLKTRGIPPGRIEDNN